MTPLPLPFERDSHDLCSSQLRKPEPENAERQANHITNSSSCMLPFLLLLLYNWGTRREIINRYTHIYNMHTYKLLLFHHCTWKLIVYESLWKHSPNLGFYCTAVRGTKTTGWVDGCLAHRPVINTYRMNWNLMYGFRAYICFKNSTDMGRLHGSVS